MGTRLNQDYKQRISFKGLAKEHNTVPQVSVKPATPRSQYFFCLADSTTDVATENCKEVKMLYRLDIVYVKYSIISSIEYAQERIQE